MYRYVAKEFGEGLLCECFRHSGDVPFFEIDVGVQ